MMNIPTMTTENLYLRPFSQTDVPDMFHILNGENVLQYFPSTKPPTQEQVQKMIDLILQHWREKGYGLWAVTDGVTHQLLGRCGLQYIPETNEVEIDYILGRPFWGKGYATEAGQAVMRFGINELKLDTIVGIVHPENMGSQRVLQKLKMAFVEETEYFGMACYKYEWKRPYLSEI